jgi:aminoglycoside phosphotransferase
MRSVLRHRAAEAAVFKAPAPALSEHLLTGHSGARVVLHSKGMDSFVRKTAAGAANSARLKAQADKQHAFWMFGLPFPKVHSQTLDAEGVASFDMNYIPGRTFADMVANGGTFDPGAVVKAVERLMRLFTTHAGGALPSGLFEAKIADVVRSAAITAKEPALLNEIRNCSRLLMARDWSGIPETPCHGDLTLENILLTTGKSVAFIDCDECFASSHWLDFGKLFQDIDGHWCIRALYAADTAPLLNAVQKLEQLGARFRRLAEELDADLPPRLAQLAALGLFRAIPYARSTTLVSFLCRRIEHVLET